MYPSRAPAGSLLLRVLLAALAGLMVAGCGYQLRGGIELPGSLSPVQVRGGSDDLRQRLALFLTGGGARIADDAEEAESILAVQTERFDERVLSVDSQTGKAREFEVTYTVSFEMIRPDGRVLLPRREVNLVRDYVFDPNAVIGKSRERGVLEEEMRRDAAEQIVRTVARISHQPTAAGAGLPAPTALRSAKVLDVLSSFGGGTRRDSAALHPALRHLRALASRAGEKCGLGAAVAG